MPTVTQAVEALVRATVDMPDAEMDRAWVWREYDEEGLRFALLLAQHELRDLAVRLAAMRPVPPTQAQRILGQYHYAYRDLTGAVAGLRDDDLDRAPAEGEWPVREADVRTAMFEIHRRVLRELGDLRDEDLERPAGFWDGVKPIRFRLHRFEAHYVQHTIQIDKTLEAIGRGPSEARRLVRVLYRDLAAVEMLSDGFGQRERGDVAKTIGERAAEINRT
jgi:hypothetical protein